MTKSNTLVYLICHKKHLATYEGSLIITQLCLCFSAECNSIMSCVFGQIASRLCLGFWGKLHLCCIYIFCFALFVQRSTRFWLCLRAECDFKKSEISCSRGRKNCPWQHHPHCTKEIRVFSYTVDSDTNACGGLDNLWSSPRCASSYLHVKIILCRLLPRCVCVCVWAGYQTEPLLPQC